MTTDLRHPDQDGPAVAQPGHDHGDAADALLRPSRDRRLAFAVLERAGASHPAVGLLRAVGACASAWREADGPVAFDLPAMTPDQRAILDQVLGEGEVRGRIRRPEVAFAEAVCAGIWLVRDGGGDHVEVGAAPRALVEAAAAPPVLAPPDAATAPTGLMNALPVLGELASRSAGWRPGLPGHVVSLTLLPMSPADQAFMAEVLGEGTIEVESRGYGFARVTGTNARAIWRVRFFNAMGTAIQDTVEVGDVPVSVAATAEDVRDGGARLLEILDTYL